MFVSGFHTPSNHHTTTHVNDNHINESLPTLTKLPLSYYTRPNDVSKNINSKCPVESSTCLKSTVLPTPTDADRHLQVLRKHNDTTSSTKNIQVIIVSQKRSGTSFVGELFNQSADFTYFFEPLSSLTTRMLKGLTTGYFEVHAKQILSGILRGNFAHMPTGWWSGDIPQHTCWCMNLASISTLCGPTELPDFDNLAEKMKLLGAFTRSRRGVAIKAIRIQNIPLLKEFVLDPTMNIKIIHLIRDPRGVMNSRYRMPESNADLLRRRGPRADEIGDLCQHMERNLRYMNESWLSGRYKLVRYEDIAERPLKVAKDIYDFVGLQLPQRVKTWLYKHTRNTPDGYAFSHTRNSKQAAYAWRLQLDYHRVVAIQARCRTAMTMLGYLPIMSYFDLANAEIRTVGELPSL